MSSTPRVLYANRTPQFYVNRTNDFSGDISVDHNAIDEILNSINEKGIRRIAKKMTEVVSNSLSLELNPKGQFHRCYHSKKIIDAKSLLLEDLPFEWDLERTLKCVGPPGLEYSYNDFLKWATRGWQGAGKILPELIGAELASKAQYRIRLTLDFQKTQMKDRLVFQITESNGDKELSRIQFST